MKLRLLFVLAIASCSDPTDPPSADAGPDSAPSMTCDEHPELAQIESISCAVDADCPIITACAPLVCGPAGGCVFGPLVADGTACELGGACVSRRCCHDVAVIP